MAVNLSPVGGAAAQFFTNNGVILSGGKLYSYAAGTTTPAVTYTSVSGVTNNTNPIILDSAGRVPNSGEIWLDNGNTYKFVLKDSSDVLIATYDNIAGINDSTELLAYEAALAASSGSSLVGFIQAGTGPVATTVQAKLRETVSVLDFGADTTGVISSSTAFSNANSSGNQIVIPKGTYLLSTSVTFTVPVIMEYGAIITIPTSITLAFNSGFSAGVHQCFNTTGTGIVTFNPQYTAEGFAEWWGAAGGSGTDSGPAINAAIIALLKVQLMGADYFSSVTIKMQLPHRELCGVGYSYADTTDQVTRILVTSGSLDVMLVGPDAEPATINNFQQQNAVRNLVVARSVAPVISSACSGITVQYTLYAQFENVKSNESIYGFEFFGSVYTIVTNCQATRASAGTGAGTDLWYGYYINGFADIGAAGGNASLYLNYCTAGCNLPALSASGSTGFYANNAFTDVYMESPETVTCTTSISVIGNASATLTASNTDFMIKNSINDQFNDYGIYIRDVNDFGSISITNPYFGPEAGAASCIYVEDSNGSVRIDGGQFVMAGAPACFGITLDNVSNAIIDLPQILESSTSGVNAIDAVSCYIAPFCKNYQNTLANAAVQFTSGCNANYVAPFVNGDAGIAALGVQLIGATNGRNEINCTGLNSSAVAGGSANKLTINGVQVTATGLSGTNLVSGVMT